MRPIGLTLLTVLLPMLGVACGRNVDLKTALKIGDVHTGWYDAGIVEGGKNKLVPSISFKLQNVSTDHVNNVQLNAIFRRANEPDVWGEHFAQAIGNEGVASGATSHDIVLRSNLGYTGTQARMEMLRNAEFVDARVEIFAKHGASTWVKIGDFTIDRQLLTQ